MPIERDRRARCPYCGATTDDATDPDGQAIPKAGDWSLCFYCGRPGVFIGDGLLTRRLTEAEITEALADPNLIRWHGTLLAYLAEQKQ